MNPLENPYPKVSECLATMHKFLNMAVNTKKKTEKIVIFI